MNPRTLCQISVATSSEAEEAVAALLERLFGQPAAAYVSAETGGTVVTVYSPQSAAFPKREALAAGLRFIAECGLKTGPSRISINRIRREDWAESWRKHFKAIAIGSTLLVKPSWNRRQPGKGQAVVVLDPGLSFGTGQHATTSFCLHQIAVCQQNGQSGSFLDIGTGSGILAIAAAKLGYSPVSAFDNDPVAVRVARANARRNQVHNRVSITRCDLSRLSPRPRCQYDLICANLVDTLLISELECILSRLRSGGRLVLAGVLATQFAPVRRAYEAAGLKLMKTEIKREWQSAAFLRSA